ncbi:MAG: OmpH family outer membrane protein [Gammaproteobacteria bacterium]|jgi:outer membrane protein|nr:OmpH family outer membrane protein [Gammaproteobacteria bacterium]MBT4147020.1 OmpH family outer membrane protein [Gammaproteobacteria bacterium]MBT5223381.1 OmpH family outer membrane protein [Gammaproteobacteria bacterium]MBT5825434.1 OmpH family outer membrane protein [Gammaproteobacteria bacterium]MBT6421035.1 OmpH family outer membrane protein [Gammaproteobacteria bacterium]
MLKKLAVLLGLLILSQTTQAEVRIGVVNIPLLMANAPQAADAKKRLEKEFSPKDKQLVAQQKKIKSLEEKLARDGMTMTDTKKRDLERQIIAIRRDAQRAQQEFKEDFSIRRNEELGKMQNRIIEAVKALAEEGDYDLLLTEGVIHASDKVDVTEKVQEKLSKMP